MFPLKTIRTMNLKRSNANVKEDSVLSIPIGGNNILSKMLGDISNEGTQYSSDFLSQLKKSIDYAKEEFKELDIKNEEYNIVNIDCFYNIEDKYYTSSSFNICSIFIPVKKIGLSNNNPYFQKNKNHFDTLDFRGYGINLYRIKDTKIYFSVISIPTNVNHGEAVSAFLVKKGYMSKILLKYKDHVKKNMKKAKKPILNDKMFNAIINNSIGLLKSKKELDKWNIKIKKGLLLTGPPGNGKTTMCKYIRDECSRMGYSYSIIENSELASCIQQNKSLSDLINGIDVAFFDDVDVDYFNRSSSQSSVACGLLTALDGMVDNKYSIRIFSTNEEVQELDPAFCRPGRIDHIYEFDIPSPKLRKKYFEFYNQELKDYINENNIDIIEDTESLSFADLEFIRTQMVIEYIQTGKWNYKVILEELIERKREIGSSSKERIGFGG